MRILLVEDNLVIGKTVLQTLRDDHHAVDWAQNLAAAEAFVGTYSYELVVLDLNLPDGYGLSMLKQTDQWKDTPAVLILSAQDSLFDRIAGLDAGADDYLVKPFEMEELRARVRVLERRLTGRSACDVLAFGDLQLHSKKYAVFFKNAPLPLARREFACLKLLIERAETVVTKDDLIDHVYDASAPPLENAVEVLISRIRKKMPDSKVALKTVRGVGYMLMTGN